MTGEEMERAITSRIRSHILRVGLTNLNPRKEANMPQYTYISNIFSNLAFDIKGADPARGTPIIAWPQKYGDNQLWIITDDGFIESKLIGSVIDSKDAIPGPGADIITYPRRRGAADSQRWSISKDGFIHSRLNNLVLDIKGGALTPGAQIITWPKKSNGTENQRWLFEDLRKL